MTARRGAAGEPEEVVHVNAGVRVWCGEILCGTPQSVDFDQLDQATCFRCVTKAAAHHRRRLAALEERAAELLAASRP